MCFQVLKLEQGGIYVAVLPNREQSRLKDLEEFWRYKAKSQCLCISYVRKASTGGKCVFPAQQSKVIPVEEHHPAA